MAVLNEEQEMLRDMAREWTKNEHPVAAWRQVRDAGKPFDEDAWTAMAEMGWAGIIIPEEHGGTDFGWLSLGLVVEETGKTLAAGPLVPSALAASAIVLGGSEEQKSEFLPRLATGELIGTIAFDEGPRHAGLDVSTSVHDGRLTGTKAFVHEASRAGIYIVLAQDGVYLVEKGKGVSIAKRAMVDMRDHAEIDFNDAPAQKLAAGGSDLAQKILDHARVLTAAEMLGMSQAVFDTTLDYLKQRVQFNQVLATFQALQHRMADLYTELELGRSAVEGGLQAIDSGFAVTEAAALAKARANDLLHHMSKEGLQLHGGIGMTDEYDVGFFLKRARILEASWGSSSHLRDLYATMKAF
ncbi:acyl-CoA dehydrogenase family protein [Alteriqipengyuania lutimaris]|uniref:Acyl-CoA dehydrogenase n=1 Tax=Alteriqipengyuania lutimaris TaxID=1538146 RepID=A0A395LV96_9SPHN|nr:acyl-CoA dehydrogenase family protein [Alteriqipengyuania lutimaris]MBB3032527.1 alkylation response protein AidB-like acyl-CoA dehydrogenase [Alteriqipengyuania lutimaris]RDS78340.1 acyl-CoA dehydrogenase [Alteriqipengyuania lutimaris]